MQSRAVKSARGAGLTLPPRLRLFPFGFAHGFDLMLKNKNPLFVSNNNVGIFSVAHKSGGHLGAHTRVRVDQMRHKLGLTLGGANQFEPIEYGLAIRVGVAAVLAMSPEPLSRDNVF